jgi:putative hydrolase of the HAD superfamily
MSIQAVFFDMGGTIETFWQTPALRLEATPGIQQKFLSAGIELHLSNEQLLEVISNGLERYHRWRLVSMEELAPQIIWREYILADYPEKAQVSEAVAEDLMLYIETHFYQRTMRPEIPAVLEEIRKMGLKIGLISNVSSRGQVPLNLEAYGIRHYFDPVVLSSEYGRRKPDPAIFHYAARLVNVPTSECAYVGDRVSRDIVGSRKAGYRLAVQIKHDFKHGEVDAGAIPDALISNMTELVDILRVELNQTAGAHVTALRGFRQRSAFLFDAGDVLYYRPYRNRKFKAFLNELSLRFEDNYNEERQSLMQLAYQGQMGLDQYREAVLRLYGVTKPMDLERGKRILEEEDNDICFFDGVKETLWALKEKGYLLGVVTDTASPLYIKLAWFERGGFGEVWDAVISSQELGVRKPNAKIYLAALQQLGLMAEQAIFIGHKASELKGARAVGMKTIAFNNDETAKADYFIKQFSDLLNIPFVDPAYQVSTR